MLVTVITCFYNEEAFLSEAVSSVLEQEYLDWELILVDDGSIDWEGQPIGAVTSAQGKARAALLFGLPTKEVQDAMAAGKPVSAMITSPAAGAWEITIGQGGLPILKDGKVVAAIGCGGSLPANDEKFAQAGINAMGSK